MVNTAFRAPQDFELFAFADWKETVTRTSVSTTTNILGDEVLADVSTTAIEAIIMEVSRGSKLFEKLGYIDEINGVIYVKTTQDLSLNDVIVCHGRTFRCLTPITRYLAGTAMYKVAGLILIDMEEVSSMGFTITTGSGAPTSTPLSTGNLYIDTDNDYVYIATGTSSSADWKQVLVE